MKKWMIVSRTDDPRCVLPVWMGISVSWAANLADFASFKLPLSVWIVEVAAVLLWLCVYNKNI